MSLNANGGADRTRTGVFALRMLHGFVANQPLSDLSTVRISGNSPQKVRIALFDVFGE